jgi:hypothetical protein
MLVSAFWFGVIATLAAEFVIATIHVMVTDAKEQKEEEKDERS